MLQRLVREIRQCLHELDAGDVPGADLEHWAVLIFESMSASSRTFHSVKHVFEVSEGMTDPIQILAAFFHDIVYYCIDGGLTIDQEKILRGIIVKEDGVVCLREKFIIPHYQRCKNNDCIINSNHHHDNKDDDEDVLISLVASIFNFKPGQILNPFRGLNEFLSAACAVRCLRHHLHPKHLAKIATCIEATIPFRKPDHNGHLASDQLYHNLQETNDKFSLNMPSDEIIKAVHHAVNLANRDLENFAKSNHAKFLSNTWNLMHESNINLRHTVVYRISTFAQALKKMSTFFVNLDAASIYESFHNVPSQEEIEDLTKRAKNNIDVASRYVQAKFLAVSVLAALAELTGGDAPLALFAGARPLPDMKKEPYDDGKQQQKSCTDLEDFISLSSSPTCELNDETSSSPEDVNSITAKVYDLLKNGREGGATNFDIKNSPLAAYLYGVLGEAGLDRCLKYAICPMDGKNARLLLNSLPRKSVVYIAEPCAILAESREELLMEIVKEYSD